MGVCVSVLFSKRHLLSLQLGPPDAPSKPMASNIGVNKMIVSWGCPESDGGTPITGYYVESKTSSNSDWIRITSEPIAETTFTAVGLAEKTVYQFCVIAVTKAGMGPRSESSDTVSTYGE